MPSDDDPPERPAGPVAFPSYTELTQVYEARREEERALVRAILAGADVPVFAWSEHARGAAGLDLEGGARTLLVPAAFARRALAVLREHGVLPPETASGATDDLARLWQGEVVPLLAASALRPLADALALQPSLRGPVCASLQEAGPRGASVLVDLVVALAVRGPKEAAREAAQALSAREPGRARRAEAAAALGALVLHGAPADLAVRVAGTLERFRGLPEAERALVPLLEHADGLVRDAAIEALFSVSLGESLGYDPEAPAPARALAVGRWWMRVGGRAT